MEVGATTIATSFATFAHAEHEPDIADTKAAVREIDSPRHFDREFRGRGLALGILRQELKFQLSAGLRTAIPGFAGTDVRASAADVAAEALSAARRLLIDSSSDASDTVLTLKSKIEQAAASTQALTGSDDDFAEVEDALSLVNTGLDDLGTEVANTFESSASVLEVQTQLSQRSTIRIRTQEGDIVKLDLRRTESLSATDIAVSNADGFASSTEVELSSQSRLTFKVNGDLNDAELAAIQNIFAQAEAIATEFFGGDLTAAFDLASGLEYDTEQLARVRLRFREEQTSEVSFAAIGQIQAEPVDEVASIPASGTDVAPVVSEELSSGSEIAPVVSAVPTTDDVVPDAEPDTVPVDVSVFAGFLDLISNYLRATSGSFGEDSGNNAISARFFYSESFKLELLKTVIEITAPAESEDGAALAATVIDAVSGDPEPDLVS